MMAIPFLQLKKSEERRIRGGHPWIYSNEVNTAATPLKQFSKGEEVLVIANDQSVLGKAYVNPHSLIVARLFTQDPHQSLDVDFFRTKIQSALSLRERLFDKPYYRLVFSEADLLPGLVVDRFGDDLVVQVNTAGMDNKTAIIVEALCAVLPTTQSILLRNDSPIRIQEGLELYSKSALGTPPQETSVIENGIHFVAPLLSGQKTGWFYDHRMNRARLAAYVRGQTVLDVFSYLGAFGIQAAAFGAKQVDCIDASAAACDYILRNAALNHMEDKVRSICGDAFDEMKRLAADNKQYQVIVLDPPAFVKKAKDRQEGLAAYQRINELALKLLAPDGILFSCSCSMHISMEDLTLALQRAAFRTQQKLQIVERGHQGPDHPLHLFIPETDYLKAIIARKAS